MKRSYLLLGLLFIFVLAGCNKTNDDHPVTVLMYHHFDENEDNISSVTMPPERFKEQLTALKDTGYTSIRERDLYDYYYNDKELPENPVLITIDDGYFSNYEYAYPILEELEFYATIYVVTSSRGKTPGSSPHFTWEEGREMVESGWIDIQSHTADAHYYIDGKRKEGPFLTTKQWDGEKEETDEEYKARIREDLKESKEIIEEHIGNEVYAITYPYGGFNDDVTEVAKELGFELMYTVRKNLNGRDTSPHELNRINASGTFSGEELLEEIAKY